MNNKQLIAFILALVISALMPAMAAGNGGPGQKGQATQSSTMLSVAEQDILLWMREEEKVARDVYQTLYKVWRQSIFKNIAASEQNHMDAILKKIQQFGLVDSVLSGVGEFSNPTLQALYDRLVAEGGRSYIDALTVGAIIEDMDIGDLMAAIEETNNLGLQNTYQNLLEASKNHMRAFVGQLRNQGLDYTPQYISQELFDAIMGV